MGFTELEVFYSSGENSEERAANARSPIAVYRDISFLPSTTVVAVAVGSSSRISVCFTSHLVVYSVVHIRYLLSPYVVPKSR